MKPLRIFIVEDEPIIAITIETALLKQGYLVCGEADNVDDALISIKETNPDLVLLDIQLEGDKDGVALGEALDLLHIPYLYLTSQTDQLTINRVKQTKPLGYIVKPFTEHSLRSNIEIAWNNHLQEAPEFLSFSSNNIIQKLKQSDILYLKAFDNYCYVVTAQREYLVPKTLKFISEQLNPSIFFKTHRSFVVNTTKIESLHRNAVFINNNEIPVSRHQKEALKAILEV
ncbi:LytTR family transcriptional regulator DNA-binding domain-containing protein [Xanthomarina sp. F1114]|uniref:LytR/AlgR family response regulator transcription factor n=1 Tax=Xanthomarina sp. F1114 TaxID=2996019 RepID=UPI00225E5D17|nr:LytTR family transcriptional regulator DNA-binding domain-containing protein [Xanthomarina sp. F1114]MCX7546822.1 LytTR family transcriptional regulator DNA-binding domain-containing protein [Xanthomarina sp. F1114]